VRKLPLRIADSTSRKRATVLPQRDQARMLVREGSAVLLAGQREEKLLRGDVTDRAEIKGGTDWDAFRRAPGSCSSRSSPERARVA
jgi:hypothetical protein